jgi:hypothetical protein
MVHVTSLRVALQMTALGFLALAAAVITNKEQWCPALHVVKVKLTHFRTDTAACTYSYQVQHR